jgi:hypothetical protein
VSPKNKMYEIDRITGIENKLLDNYSYINLQQVNDGLPNSLVGASWNQTYWSFNGAPWNSDGTITFLNNTISGTSTGMLDVLTLEEYNTNTGLPTGNNKPNTLSDPDYIAPYYDTNLITGCPVTYTLTCPTILKTTLSPTSIHYEINIPTTVRDNPVINKIRISAVDSGSVVQGYVDYVSTFTSLYYNGDITGLPSGTYTLKVQYFDVSNNILATCT